ncbi:uncharacterized protein LOC143527249 [Brachyhypopomus gauderio]|uniref:uncharacterized protein LOC143527249 n=1 Tax=Brachyhypopomus gauderio TaxID=698409 RepID=UPI004042237B
MYFILLFICYYDFFNLYLNLSIFISFKFCESHYSLILVLLGSYINEPCVISGTSALPTPPHSAVCEITSFSFRIKMHFNKCYSILITGASRGLGLEMVKQLTEAPESPSKIIATARNPAAAEELQQIAKSHPKVYIVPLDVVSDVSIDAAVQQVSSIVGAEGLNCLVNNAGIVIPSDLQTVTHDSMMKNFETNTVAPLFVTKAFLPLLRKAASSGSTGMGIHRSAVVNITSLLGSIQLNWGQAGATFKMYAYRVSKAGLNMVTRCMAIDLESEGILCTAVHPGWVRTELGGPKAPLSPEESVSSVLTVISKLSEKDHGEFLNYSGDKLPW